MYGWEYRDDPFPGYDLVAEDDRSPGGYEWAFTDVFHKDGEFYIFSESGCSCNGPYEYADKSDLVRVDSFQAALVGLSEEAIEQALAWERRNR